MENPNLKSILSLFMEEVWNQGNFNNLSSYLASEYKIIQDPGDPWNGQTIAGETFKERIMYTRNAFPNVNFDLHEMIEENDRIAVRWTMSGTHSGDLPQLPATGRSFKITGMTFYYFEDGKICGHRQSFDQLSFLAQIGALAMN